MPHNLKNQKRHMKRAWDILLHQGPKAFYNKVRIKLNERKASSYVVTDERVITYQEIQSNLQISDIVPTTDKFLAVHLHLFYEDLLDEFVQEFSHIPVGFDLYISIRQDTDEDTRRQTILRKCKAIPHVKDVIIRVTENRGRDYGPMYALFGKELQEYRYVIHLHSKKSLYTGSEQQDWRQYSVQTLIGSVEQATRVINLMETHPEIGLVYPERYQEMAAEAYGWLSNEKKAKTFLESIGIPFSGGIFLYPAGSFFLVRTEAIKQIWNLNLSYSDFDEEAGQTDGTLAHVLERAISKVSTYNGFHDAVISPEREEVHVDSDKQTFLPVFRRNAKHLSMDLSAYDVISFDIFDTLLTRAVYHPRDLFSIIERQSGVSGYSEARILADSTVNHSIGAGATIQDIYAELQNSLRLSDEKTQQLLELEISLEGKYLKPRRDMVTLYQNLLASGKEIILVSDMYLTRDIIEPILESNGITGYSHLYISCQEGFRKDDDTLWDKVLSDYNGKNVAHVGDNQKSDWQMLSDRREKTTWIMNPRDEETIDGSELPHVAQGISDSVMRSIIQGLNCNLGVYNSPFALSPDGQLRFTDPYTYGFSAFGPLLYEFMTWLHDNTGDVTLQFLAREGYIFQQVYRGIYRDEAKENHYLLASRRAVSVAAIRTEDDIREILRRDYDGSMRNLVISRLGMDEALAAELPDKLLHFEEGASDDDYDKAIQMIQPYYPQILENAKEEREAYSHYLAALGMMGDGTTDDSGLHFSEADEKTEGFVGNAGDHADHRENVLVDIGYAGTIQYWMAKLLGQPVDAAYLAVFQEIPGLRELGCENLAYCRKDEANKTAREFTDQAKENQSAHLSTASRNSSFAERIDETQLFLECILQAPYGQLKHFDRNVDMQPESTDPCGQTTPNSPFENWTTTDVHPVFRVEEKPSAGIQELQRGILDYAGIRSDLERDAYGSVTRVPQSVRQQTRDYVQACYEKYMKLPLAEEVAGLFTVEDTYSQDTTLHLDGKTGRWVI
ncbi:MAG: rhamnan synthesis F family protein [Lachnospiraceae bacterium]|nr:rhamnan synthesis F family protein [Lachnospiraceae bacterium]